MPTPRCILAVNAGSSSLKLALLDAETLEPLARTVFEGLDRNARPEAALDRIAPWVEQYADGAMLLAASHRVVHGGPSYSKPVLVSRAVLEDLETLVPLAPLHQPASLAPIRVLSRQRPFLKQVACFDTAFHRGRPSSVERYGLPSRLFDEGLRRYGFHGLSYESVLAKFRRLAPDAASGRVVVAHLGSGASLCAIRNGLCVDTTMGFSTLDGVVMGTRCGALDPGAILHLLREGASVDELERLLYRESGLLGVSGLSPDVRDLLASSTPDAREALDCFVWSIVRALGSMIAMLGGLDALVFTAGIGENSAWVRSRVAGAFEWTGLDLDKEANEAGGPCLSRAGSRACAWTIPTDEEGMLAVHAKALLFGQNSAR